MVAKMARSAAALVSGEHCTNLFHCLLRIFVKGKLKFLTNYSISILMDKKLMLSTVKILAITIIVGVASATVVFTFLILAITFLILAITIIIVASIVM